MAEGVVPWLIGLDAGAKVTVDGACPIPRDTLAEWARPVESLRPIDHDPASWLLRVLRRERGGSVWTVIGFYGSGREFQNSRPHAFLGAGVLARDLVVPGDVLDPLRVMIDTWQSLIAEGMTDADTSAAAVWDDDTVRRKLHATTEGLATAPQGNGLRPGKGIHFFHVSDPDPHPIEKAITALQTGNPFFASSILFSSSQVLAQTAKDRGYGVSSAEQFGQWRAEQGAPTPKTRKRTTPLMPGDKTAALVNESRRTPLTFASKDPEPSLESLPIATALPDSVSQGTQTNVSFDVLRGHIEQLEAGIAVARREIDRLAQACNDREPRIIAPHESKTPSWFGIRRNIILMVLAAAIVLAVILTVIPTLQRRLSEPPTVMARSTVGESNDQPASSPVVSPPTEVVAQYYSLLESEPNRALALRQISPDTNLGKRIVESRRKYDPYSVTDLNASEIKVDGAMLTAKINGHLIATTAEGGVEGNVEIVVEAEKPPTGSEPQWHIKSLQENPESIVL